MARGAMNAVSPWRLRTLNVPPRSLNDWLRLAVWELWMGSLVCMLLWAGAAMIATAPDRIVTVEDLSGCYAVPPLPPPCDRIIYRTGAMNAAFSVLSGVVMLVASLWLLWELWEAVAPKPLSDDFLRLLRDSFGASWRDPRTWPWARISWAYGFTILGGAATASIAFAAWTLMSDLRATKPPLPHVETSQDFRANQ